MGYTCNPKATSICKQISGQTTAYRSCEYLQPTLPLFLSLSLYRTHRHTPEIFTYVCMVPFILYMNIYRILQPPIRFTNRSSSTSLTFVDVMRFFLD